MSDWSLLRSSHDGLAAWHRGTDGPVVVTAHGMEDGWHTWSPVADRLAEHYRVVSLDLPWRAGNDYRWRSQGTPGQWLARALELVAEPVHALLGHSFGANATLELLAAGHTGADRVGLVAPFYRPAADAEVGDGLHERSRASLSATIRTGLRLKLGDREIDPDVLDGMEQGLVRRLMPAAFPVFFDCFAASGALELACVRVPTLVLAGTTDPALTEPRARALAAAMPAARVCQRAHYTHFCHVQQAAEVAGELAAFLTTRTLVDAVGGQLR